MRCKQAATKVSETGELSLEELTQFDGKEGRAGYIARQGIIYDISNSSKWKDGIHIGRHLAGGDLTEMPGQSPHGEAQVLAMPQIGKLRDDEPIGLPLSAKAFLHHGLYEPGFCAVDHLNSCVLEMVVAVSFLSYAIILGH
jgi:predicted heme/steroid binding protein